MRIAIDAGPLTSGHAVRGIGVHTRELINELKAQSLKLEIDAFDFSSQSLKLKTQSFDIIHYPYFHPYFITLPFQKPKNSKVVVTIHDLIYLIYPNHYPPGFKGKFKFIIQKFLLRNVDAIITISETSKKDICRFLGVHPDKVHVVYLAPRKIFQPIADGRKLIAVQKRYSLPKSFVLYVGDINYNKNIPALIHSCKTSKIPLVIVGKQAQEIEEQGVSLKTLEGPRDWVRFLFNLPHPELSHYKELLGEFRHNKNIIRLGFVPDGDLVAIYNLATVYCQPSFYEGFGLPILEAMSCGLPVIASKTQALVEIGKDACYFVDPKDQQSIAKVLEKISNDENIRNKMIKKGFDVIKNFSWKKTARETAEIYKKMFLG